MSAVYEFTPQVKEWIARSALTGQDALSILSQMKHSGWEEGQAVQAIRETLGKGPCNLPEAAPGDVSVPVPTPALSDSPSSIRAYDRTVRVLLSLRKPQIAVFGNILSAQECRSLIKLAEPRLSRSQTIDNKTGGSSVHAARTSQGMFFVPGENELVARIEQRIGALLKWPVEKGEGLQVLRYSKGAEYKPHFDYFLPDEPGTPALLAMGGQRVGSLVVYLNTPRKGGGTVFPDLDAEVFAQRGNAVFFSYDRPHPSTMTLHGGAPVIAGEKWVLTKWLRQGKFGEPLR